MSDVKAAETVKFIIKAIGKSLKETEPLWKGEFGESRLNQLLTFGECYIVCRYELSLTLLIGTCRRRNLRETK